MIALIDFLLKSNSYILNIKGWKMLFLRQRIVDNSYDGVAEKIKKDLAVKFQEKGINVSKILINMDSDYLNVKVCITSLMIK